MAIEHDTLAHWLESTIILKAVRVGVPIPAKVIENAVIRGRSDKYPRVAQASRNMMQLAHEIEREALTGT